MKYEKLINLLQNAIGFKPKAKDLADILNLKSEKVFYARAQRNSNFADEEIAMIEAHYGIELNSNDGCIDIDYIHIMPSCGHGTVVMDDAEVTPVKIGKEIIKDIWKVSNPASLKLFKASGDSMETVIEDGNILLVDTSRTDFNTGGIFILTINNDWYVKRLRLRVTGELDIISDNLKYPMETLKPDTGTEIIVKGRVIKNLSKGL